MLHSSRRTTTLGTSSPSTTACSCVSTKPRTGSRILVQIVTAGLHDGESDRRALQVTSTDAASAPIVSSVVAQMLEANPSLTPSLVKRLLIRTARRIPHIDVDRQGRGALQPKAAVEATAASAAKRGRLVRDDRRRRRRQGGRATHRPGRLAASGGSTTARCRRHGRGLLGHAQEQPEERGREGPPRQLQRNEAIPTRFLREGYVANKVAPRPVSAIDDGVDASGAVFFSSWSS